MIGPASFEGGPLLVLDGSLPEAAFVRRLSERHTPIVAADGAALQLRDFGIRPDIIIGDLDTIGPEAETPFFTESTILRRPAQDEYDGGKCLEWIRDEGFDRVSVIGVSGGMTDHVLNNFSLLARFAPDIHIRVPEPPGVGYLLCESFEFTVSPGDRISILPLPEIRVTTDGLTWDLDDDLLTIGGKTSNSNSARATTISLNVASGTGLLMHYSAVAVRPNV